MFSRVKKFRDKIFSSSTSSRGKDSNDPSEDGVTSPSRTASYSAVQQQNSPTVSAGPHSPARDYFKTRREGSAQRAADEAAAGGGEQQLAPRGASGSASRRSSNLGEPSLLSSKDALPAVQVNSSMISAREKSFHQPTMPQPVGISTAQMLSPSGSGRRKSTPAALDFALRTAEGKHAVEELLNHNTKQKLVFGQYFAGNAPPASAPQGPLSPNSQAVAKAAAVSRFQGVKSGTSHHHGASNNHPAPLVASRRDLPAAHRHDEEPAAPRAPAPRPVNVAPPSPAPKAKPSQGDGFTPSSASAGPVASMPQSGDASMAASPVAGGGISRTSSMAAHPGPRSIPTAKVIVVSTTLPATMNRKVWTLSDYNIVRKMYTGYASTVFQALCKRSLEMVALKVYHLENLCELNHYQVYREIRVHAALQHQNIIHLYCAFQEGSDVVLVQEYAEGGDLYRLLHKNGGRLHERQTVEMVLHPFLLALHYLHTNGIMHRDIKPENVLFTEQRVLKLADFGLAIDLNEERAVTRAGTLDYMAPEVLRCPPKNLPQENKNNPYLHYNNSVDAWAVGVFAYELVVGFPPFAGETQLDSVDKIMHSTPDFPEKITELAKDFICQALRKHPGDRPTVMEMLHHPWVRTYQRRTSVRMDVRRRSSVNSSMMATMLEGSVAQQAEDNHNDDGPANAPQGWQHGAHPNPTAGHGWPTGSAAVLQKQASTASSEDTPVDIADMTPEQIEAMIRKLQVAKVSAVARYGNNVHKSQ